MWLQDLMAGIGLVVFVGATFAMTSILPVLWLTG